MERAELPLGRDPNAGGHGGREGGGEAAVHFFAGGDGEREALDGAEIGGGVGGGAAARMVAEIIAGDGFVQALDAVEERSGGGHLLPAAYGELIAFVGMVIGEDVGAVAIEHEEIAVPAEGEADVGLGAECLLHAGEPGLGVLPGIEVAVELIGAEGVIHVGEVERAVAEVRGKAGDGGEIEIAVVAVGTEAGRKIAREGELLGDFLAGDAEGGALLVDAVAAECGAQAEFGDGGRLGDDVDDAAHGVGSVESGTRPAHHFDALHAFEGHRDVHIVMAGLWVVQTHAVEQHEGLAEAGAADGEIRLDAVGGAFGEVERGVELDQIDERVEHQALAADRKHADGAVDLFERHGLEGPGDDHGIVPFGGLLGEGNCGYKREKNENSEVQITLYIAPLCYDGLRPLSYDGLRL